MPELRLDDGARRIFINTKGKNPEGFTEEFLELMEYINHTTDGVAEKVKSEKIKKIHDRGTIGKRYRRQDEIGTPFCVTYDFDSEEDGAVTVRDRDTMQQERIKIDELDAYFAKKFEF